MRSWDPTCSLGDRFDGDAAPSKQPSGVPRFLRGGLREKYCSRDLVPSASATVNLFFRRKLSPLPIPTAERGWRCSGERRLSVSFASAGAWRANSKDLEGQSGSQEEQPAAPKAGQTRGLSIKVAMGDAPAEDATSIGSGDRKTDDGSSGAPSPSASRPSGGLFGDDEDNEVKLRVFDESLGVEREFHCNVKILLSRMTYFKKYLTENEDTDILIHCDIYVFSWLMKYVKAGPIDAVPELTEENCLPILIASNFLEMEDLVEHCVSFIADHFPRIVQMPSDLNFLTPQLVDQLAEEVRVASLEEAWQRVESNTAAGGRKAGADAKAVGIRSLLDQLYRKKLETLLEAAEGDLKRCTKCRKIYDARFQGDLLCHRALVRVGLDGKVDARHVPSKSWTLAKHRKHVKSLPCQDRHLYWFFWGKTTKFECSGCKETFMANDLRTCRYHPKKTLFPPGEACGYYLCCKGDASKFNSLSGCIPNTGCKECNHEVASYKNAQGEDLWDMMQMFTQVMPELPARLESDSFESELLLSEEGHAGGRAGTGAAPREVDLVETSNIKHYYEFLRHSKHQKASKEVKLHLFGQNYQSGHGYGKDRGAASGGGWHPDDHQADRSSKARQGVLRDVMQSIDILRMDNLRASLQRERRKGKGSPTKQVSSA